jgi:hypothetical protein
VSLQDANEQAWTVIPRSRGGRPRSMRSSEAGMTPTPSLTSGRHRIVAAKVCAVATRAKTRELFQTRRSEAILSHDSPSARLAGTAKNF